jgi:hypothetical protein
MEPGTWIGRIAATLLLLVAIAGGALATLYHVKSHRAPPATVFAKQSIAETENQSPQPSSQVQVQSTGSAPDDGTFFVSLVEMEVSQLNEGITLAKWMEGRGKSERWETTKPEMLVGGPDEECLSLRRTDALPSGATVVRALYFYPPPVPSPAVFPNLTGSALFSTCTLAWVRVEVEASSSAFGQAMLQAVSKQLTKRYGQSVGEKGVALRRTGLWGQDVFRWVPRAEIIANYDSKPGLDPNAPGQLLSGPVVRVYAELPSVKDLGNRSPMFRHDVATQQTQFRQAVAAAGAESALSQRMLGLYGVDTRLAKHLEDEVEEMCKTHCEAQDLPKPTGTEWRDPLVPLLQDWFKALASVKPGQRAAGLLAADNLLSAFGSVRPWDQFGTEQSSTPEQSKLRSALQELGADFETGFEDPSLHYSGNWLNEAKDMDPDTEGGQLALLAWMSSAEGCGRSGSVTFRDVISKGEMLLTKKIVTSTAAKVHFMVGDAYSDMVAIDDGVDPNGSYSSVDLGDEADSRAKSLQHYRAGLALDNTSEDAKDAWRQAWHLVAGLVPGTRYACFGD